MNTPQVNRRSFIKSTGAMTLAIGASNRVLGANDEVVLGMIGTGGRGQSLLKTITNIPGIRIGALCDLRDDRLEKAAYICENYKPAPKTYKDYMKLIENEKSLDGIMVCNEIGNHAKVVVPVLEAGFNCFSEKSMDCTVEKVDQIVAAARKSKGIYQIGFQRRYAPVFQKCIAAIHEGAIGDVNFLQGAWQWSWSVGGWVGDIEMSGGELVEQACHHMDVMSWVMKGQKPLKAVAMGLITRERNNFPEHPSEDHSAVMFEFPGDVIFSYNHLFLCPKEFEYERLWVYGSKGGVDLPAGMKYPRPGMGDAENLYPAPDPQDWGRGTSEQLESFARHIRNNEKPLSNEITGAISTLTAIMGHKAMYKMNEKKWEPSIVTWDDLGSTTLG